MKTTLLCVLIAALGAACLQRADRAPPASDTSAVPNSTATPAAPAPAAAPTLPPSPGATKLTVVEGFLTPESVLHDPVQDIYFVSNINGSPTAKDNNGFISRVRPDGAVENLKFIEGGHGGVTLNAPKGLAIRGDTLWVADIDVVRAFDAKTGAPRDSVSMASLGAVFLNDIAIAQTGALYITDTGIRFDDVGNVLHPGPDRIFRVGTDRQVTVAVRGDTLGRPNGITLDSVGKRFIVVQFGGRSILAWKPGDKAPSVIAKGPGGFDGVEIAGSRVLVSSWSDSTVSSYETGQEVKLRNWTGSEGDCRRAQPGRHRIRRQAPPRADPGLFGEPRGDLAAAVKQLRIADLRLPIGLLFNPQSAIRNCKHRRPPDPSSPQVLQRLGLGSRGVGDAQQAMRGVKRHDSHAAETYPPGPAL